MSKDNQVLENFTSKDNASRSLESHVLTLGPYGCHAY